jgi:hypothetical protein
MKVKKGIYLFGVVLIMTTSGGCGMLTESPEIPVSPVQQLSPTLSAVITTETPTATPTLTRTPTYVPTLTTTITLAPALSTEAARLRLLDLLANNGNCRLPCLWGITPGISSYLDGQYILAPLVSSTSESSFFTSGRGGIDIGYPEGELTITASTRFLTYPNTDIISHFRFDVGAYKAIPEPDNPERTYFGFVFDSTVFGKQLAFYMLPHILSEYGRPSSVLVNTLPGPNQFGDMGLFYLILMYPDQGFVVHYTTLAGSNVLGCMVNAHVIVDVYPSGHGDTFYELLPTGYSDVSLDSYKPLEEVTSMSLDQFYQTFQKPTDQCIVTASSHWPDPYS